MLQIDFNYPNPLLDCAGCGCIAALRTDQNKLSNKAMGKHNVIGIILLNSEYGSVTVVPDA